MRSPRTEVVPPEPTSRLHLPRGLTAVFQRLNTRLVLAIASVSLVGLVVSAVSVNQVLSGYFADETTERLRTAQGATGLLIQFVAENERVRGREGILLVPELRDNQVIRPAVLEAVPTIIAATITVHNADGQLVVSASPSAQEVESLLAAGLRRERIEITPIEFSIQLPDGSAVAYVLQISDPYTSREATTAQIRSAVVGAGLLALTAAFIFGAVAARRVTAPIHRLRRVAGRVAQGELDERATVSGVLEVDELTAQFNDMADRLAGSLRMLEADRDRLRDFVADVSHELRTPIAALRIYTDLQRDGDVDEATRAEFLARTTEQIGRLEWLSTNLLDLSRIDAGIFPLDMRSGDLRDPIQAVVQALSGVAVARGIALESFVPSSSVDARFDRERVIQLLTNLIGNAIKFTPRGGSVSVRLGEEPEQVVIEVRDTGVGIPADELPRVFERFYRGTNTGDARASGSGLGLAIVRSIVDMHAGEIGVASVLGDGTAFRILLPRGHGAAGEAPADKVNETSRSGHPARNPDAVA